MLQHVFKGNRSDMHIFKPIRGIRLEDLKATASVRVSLVNSSTGETKIILPLAPARMYMELGSWGEGFYRQTVRVNGDSVITGYIAVSGTGVSLDNDKYISVDVVDNILSSPGNPDEYLTKLYGIETSSIPQRYLYSVQRMFLPVGELQKRFGLSGSEQLVVPIRSVGSNGLPDPVAGSNGLESLQLSTTSGISPIYRPEELDQLIDESNDVVMKFYSPGNDATLNVPATYCVLDLSGVTAVDVTLVSGSPAFELWKVDIRDSAMPDVPLPSNIRDNAMQEITIPAEPQVTI